LRPAILESSAMRNLVVLIVLLAGACSKSKTDQAISEMGGFRDQMCKCTDKECADKVHADYEKAGEKYKDAFGEQVSKEKMEAMEKVEKEYRDCRNAKKGGTGEVEEAIVTMVQMTDKMCACADKPCAEKVNDEYTKWGQEMMEKRTLKQKQGQATETATGDNAKKIADTMKRYSECMDKTLMK
jgi:hypothetical protein